MFAPSGATEKLVRVFARMIVISGLFGRPMCGNGCCLHDIVDEIYRDRVNPNSMSRQLSQPGWRYRFTPRAHEVDLAAWRGLRCVSTSDPDRRSVMARSGCSKLSAIRDRYRQRDAQWACRTVGHGCWSTRSTDSSRSLSLRRSTEDPPAAVRD